MCVSSCAGIAPVLIVPEVRRRLQAPRAGFPVWLYLSHSGDGRRHGENRVQKMTTEKAVRVKRPYAVDHGKVVEGKKSCDRCRKKNPPIFECFWSASLNSGSKGYYMDCCQPCIELMSDLVNKGKFLGPFGELS